MSKYSIVLRNGKLWLWCYSMKLRFLINIISDLICEYDDVYTGKGTYLFLCSK